MTTAIKATFTIDAWEPGTSADTDAGETLGRAVLRKTWGGDVEGTSVAEMMSAGVDESGRAYLAQERVVGSLLGREGSFVLQHGAAGGEGFEPRQWAFVVPGTGTGALAGLQGEGRLDHGRLELEVTLPPEPS